MHLELVFLHGLALSIALAVTWLVINLNVGSFLVFNPPLGFALLLFVVFIVVPIIVGALNVALIRKFYIAEGWQIGFWLNGFFLLLIFLAANVVLQTVWHLQYTSLVAIAEIFLLALPFGWLGRLSNWGG